MKLIDEIRKWPEKRKRNFSIFLALFLTVLIIIINSAFNIIWPESSKKQSISDSREFNNMKESFNDLINNAQPLFNQFDNLSSTSAIQTVETIEQDNSTSSSFGSTTNVVE